MISNLAERVRQLQAQAETVRSVHPLIGSDPIIPPIHLPSIGQALGGGIDYLRSATSALSLSARNAITPLASAGEHVSHAVISFGGEARGALIATGNFVQQHPVQAVEIGGVAAAAIAAGVLTGGAGFALVPEEVGAAGAIAAGAADAGAAGSAAADAVAGAEAASATSAAVAEGASATEAASAGEAASATVEADTADSLSVARSAAPDTAITSSNTLSTLSPLGRAAITAGRFAIYGAGIYAAGNLAALGIEALGFGAGNAVAALTGGYAGFPSSTLPGATPPAVPGAPGSPAPGSTPPSLTSFLTSPIGLLLITAGVGVALYAVYKHEQGLPKKSGS
jgi:hypothetical protein